jgi:hypothetical protein
LTQILLCQIIDLPALRFFPMVKGILDSIDLMIQDQKRKLLETTSDESDRKQFELYDALREVISKAWQSIR